MLSYEPYIHVVPCTHTHTHLNLFSLKKMQQLRTTAIHPSKETTEEGGVRAESRGENHAQGASDESMFIKC